MKNQEFGSGSGGVFFSVGFSFVFGFSFGSGFGFGFSAGSGFEFGNNDSDYRFECLEVL